MEEECVGVEALHPPGVPASLQCESFRAMAQILITDDDADQRAVLGEVLRSVGYKVIFAADGEEAIKVFQAAPTDLVIVDLYMPNRDGVEVIRELRRDFPRVPIIAMSGNPMARVMLSVASQLGAAELLQKPFQPAELLAAVERTLLLNSPGLRPAGR